LTSGLGGKIAHGGLEYAELNGGAGDNELDASSFNGIVALYGNDGNDVLRGTSNGDALYGGAGYDQLFGGLGDDVLYGGAGIDAFFFDGTAEKDDLRLTNAFLGIGKFERFDSSGSTLLEQDILEYDIDDTVQIRAGEGNDQISVDLAFAFLGTVDGGDGDDFCTAPDDWTRISC
jgi:hypothetical protein